jgi:hypothetical protein
MVPKYLDIISQISITKTENRNLDDEGCNPSECKLLVYFENSWHPIEISDKDIIVFMTPRLPDDEGWGQRVIELKRFNTKIIISSASSGVDCDGYIANYHEMCWDMETGKVVDNLEEYVIPLWVECDNQNDEF